MKTLQDMIVRSSVVGPPDPTCAPPGKAKVHVHGTLSMMMFVIGGRGPSENRGSLTLRKCFWFERDKTETRRESLAI